MPSNPTHLPQKVLCFASRYQSWRICLIWSLGEEHRVPNPVKEPACQALISKVLLTMIVSSNLGGGGGRKKRIGKSRYSQRFSAIMKNLRGISEKRLVSEPNQSMIVC